MSWQSAWCWRVPVVAAGRPIHSNTTGSSTTAINAAAPSMVLENPYVPIASTSGGVMKTPPELAPFSARLMASGRFSSNHSPTTVLMAPTCMVAAPTAISR